ncbi:MAG: ATP-dependent DNA helicase RecG, partial [Patescibacteria group bacterium]
PVGTQTRLAGKIDWFGHKIVMTSPVHEIGSSLHTGRLVPIYPETQGVSSKWLRGRIAFIIQQCIQQVIEYLPDSIIEEYRLISIHQAIEHIHYPTDPKSAQNANRRLAFEEFFFLQLRAWEERRLWQQTNRSHQCKIDESEVSQCIRSLPFTLTNDQQTTTKEILTDITLPYPMNRLLEGDVGAGKTVVAAIAMYVAYKNGLQSMLMAPTQILAEQHYATIKGFLDPFGVRIGLVTGSQKTERACAASPPRTRGSSVKQILDSRLRGNDKKWGGNDKFDILVGTHALLSSKIKLERLGLVVIDEQQRFGVLQRGILVGKTKNGKTPHMLTMTATPIPRTVARTLFGNLDLSVLATIPDGRKEVKTWVVPKEKRENAYKWIKNKLNETGGQAYIVCPLIEESETLTSVKAVKTEYELLKSIFSGVSIGLLHGRMKSKEKTTALDRFRTRKDAILLATPVVEVGIDIPNAIIILIEAAERFGLAQLHQLRGRVGRGRIASFCLLFTETEDALTLKRLKSLETIHNGPELADIDLALRGPGELFGTRQHGIPDLKIARWTQADLIAQSQKAVKALTSADPTLTSFPLLMEKLKNSTIHAAHQD